MQHPPNMRMTRCFAQSPAVLQGDIDCLPNVLVRMRVHFYAAGFSYLLSAGTAWNSISINFSLFRPLAWAA